MPVSHSTLMEQWARIISGIFRIVFYTGIVMRLRHWLKNPNAGHKNFLRFVITYFCVQACVSLYWVLAIYMGTRRGVAYTTLIGGAAVGFLFVMTEINARKIENTLEASEKESAEIGEKTSTVVREIRVLNERAKQFKERQRLHIISNAARSKGA